MRLNTVYQLLADPGGGNRSTRAPWIMMPEYILYSLGARRVCEYTNATHTGLVDLKTGTWIGGVFRDARPSDGSGAADCAAGTLLGPMTGPLASLDAFSETQMIVPAMPRYGIGDRGDSGRSELDGLHQFGDVVAGGDRNVGAGDDARGVRLWVYEYGRGDGRADVSLADQQHVGAETVHGCVGRGGAAMED